MRTRNYRYFVGDFETTVYEGQEYTEVWASACVELGSEDVELFHSIDEQWEYFTDLNCDLICYYHNLKFDGSFWLSYLIKELGYKQAYTQPLENVAYVEWDGIRDMPNGSLTYAISDMGQWYNIRIKVHNHIIEFRDSLKLLPFSVKRIGKSFKTKHQKLDMEYTGFRYAGCTITDEEAKYIKNDVLVIKEALELMFKEGHTQLTIGACCLYEFKKTVADDKYDELFPNLYEMPLDESVFGSPNVGLYISRSYRGGWCYIAKGKAGRVFRNGTTADVNSLYASMMSSESGNRYPMGEPHFWQGNYIPDICQDRYYFVRFRCRFRLKPGMLPFIQIKHSMLYPPREMLETSDIYYKGSYHEQHTDCYGNTELVRPLMTLTCTDWELFNKYYDVTDLEILDGCWFYSIIGVFDRYIDRYKQIKLTSEGAMKQLAKLFLTNLYGKMAASTRSDFKVAYIKDGGELGFFTVVDDGKIPGYIPVGSAITSYARAFTITAAQANYHGPDKPGFIYSDTDSIHCDLAPDDLKGVKEDPKAFCCWKFETCWDRGYFVRPKTYIEHVTHNDRMQVEPYYNVKCAGMPDKCKNLFIDSLMGKPPPADADDNIKEFLKVKRDITDFKVGLSVPGKLVTKFIPGGIVLQEVPYEIRKGGY